MDCVVPARPGGGGRVGHGGRFPKRNEASAPRKPGEVGACKDLTFRLDESLPTTTLLPPVPQSTRLLRRNHTTLTKYNLVSSITTRRRHRPIGHGDINKIILQLLGDLLTPHLQRLPTKSRFRRTSSSRRPLIFVTNNQKNSSRATI